jgi:hypothetical protein
VTPSRPTDRVVSATDAVAEHPSEVVVVRLDAGAAKFPDECAGCGAFATASEVIGSGTRAVVVPYCTACLRRSGAARTRHLATVIASLLLAVAVVGGGPLVWPWVGPLALTFGAILASASPLAVSLWVLPRLLPHLATPRAVFFTFSGELAFRRPYFAERAALLSGAKEPRAARRKEPLGIAVLAGPLLAALGGPALHWLHHPLVRLLNLRPEVAFVEVDGRVVAEVLGSSVESPEAGVDVRLPAGPRQIVTRSRDGVVDERRVVVRSGRHHLYAPGAHDYCFWLETTNYGRAGPAPVGRVELPRGAGFWVLPKRIDTWFSQNPARPGETRSSGGNLTALRQARCRDLPPELAGDR